MKKIYTKEDLVHIETEYAALLGAIERVAMRCLGLGFGQVIGIPKTWTNLHIDTYEIRGDEVHTEAGIFRWGENELSIITFPLTWLGVANPDDLITNHCQKIVDDIASQKANLEERTKNRALELERAEFERLKAKFEKGSE